LGAQISDKTSQNSIDIEEFLAGLRFGQKGKLDELLIQNGSALAADALAGAFRIGSS
jgi:hypothetical protein